MNIEEKEVQKTPTFEFRCGYCRERCSIPATTPMGLRNYPVDTPSHGFVCESCIDEFFGVCEQCSDLRLMDTFRSCAYCVQSACNLCTAYCSYCEVSYCSGDGACEEGHNSDHGDNTILYREPDTETREYCDGRQKKGSIITSSRKFGAEIELMCEDRREAGDISKELPQPFGISEDGSLAGEGEGIEIQTPILALAKGEEAIMRSMQIVNGKTSSYVNTSCGLHVHLDGRDIMSSSYHTLKRLFLFYFAFDCVLLAMLPKSRRNNRYCYALNTVYQLEDLKAISSHADLERLWYQTYDKYEIKDRKHDKKDGSRYKGINLHPLISDNHLEIRYHSGTTNPRKILYWVALHQRILDRIASGEISEAKILYAANDGKTIEDKIKLFFMLLDLPENLKRYVKERIKKFSVNEVVDEAELTCAE